MLRTQQNLDQLIHEPLIQSQRTSGLELHQCHEMKRRPDLIELLAIQTESHLQSLRNLSKRLQICFCLTFPPKISLSSFSNLSESSQAVDEDAALCKKTKKDAKKDAAQKEAEKGVESAEAVLSVLPSKTIRCSVFSMLISSVLR